MPKKKFAVPIGLGAAVSGAAGAYKFSEFILRAKKLHEVGSENEVFARLIQRVRVDFEESIRLLRLPAVRFALSRSPAKRRYIESTLDDTEEALHEIGRYTEPVTKDLKDGDHVGIRNRMKWVLDSHERLVHRRLELATCHQSLSQILAFLAPLEPLACCKNPDHPGEHDEMVETYQEVDRLEPPRRDLPPPRDDFDKEIYYEKREYTGPENRSRRQGQWPSSRL